MCLIFYPVLAIASVFTAGAAWNAHNELLRVLFCASAFQEAKVLHESYVSRQLYTYLAQVDSSISRSQ